MCVLYTYRLGFFHTYISVNITWSDGCTMKKKKKNYLYNNNINIQIHNIRDSCSTKSFPRVVCTPCRYFWLWLFFNKIKIMIIISLSRPYTCIFCRVPRARRLQTLMGHIHVYTYIYDYYCTKGTWIATYNINRYTLHLRLYRYCHRAALG